MQNRAAGKVSGKYDEKTLFRQKYRVVVYVWTSQHHASFVKAPQKNKQKPEYSSLNQESPEAKKEVGHVAIYVESENIYLSFWPKDLEGKGFVPKTSNPKEYFMEDLNSEERPPEFKFSFYKLKIDKMKTAFEEICDKKPDWSLTGLYFFGGGESCASSAWKLLVAGGIEKSISRMEQSSYFSKASSQGVSQGSSGLISGISSAFSFNKAAAQTASKVSVDGSALGLEAVAGFFVKSLNILAGLLEIAEKKELEDNKRETEGLPRWINRKEVADIESEYSESTSLLSEKQTTYHTPVSASLPATVERRRSSVFETVDLTESSVNQSPSVKQKKELTSEFNSIEVLQQSIPLNRTQEKTDERKSSASIFFDKHINDKTIYQNLRKGLKDETKFTVLLQQYIPKGLILGKAHDKGDCFFDALGQCLNRINNNDVNTDKYLRMLCHDYYEKNKVFVDKLNARDYNSTDEHDNYYMVQYTAEECERDFSGRPPIWGRPYVEGIMLCNQLKLRGLCVIEILEQPETKQPVLSFHWVNQENYISISEQDAKELISNPEIPTLVVEQNSLHFVPLLVNLNHPAVSNEVISAARPN